MSSSLPSESFGAFKPVGHLVIAFPPGTDLGEVTAELRPLGIADANVHPYPALQMGELIAHYLKSASQIAAIGQEVNLMQAQGELAAKGCEFLVVKSSGSDLTARVVDVARRHGALRAQAYGTFIIEELIEPGTGESQVGESPDRGLDPQTREGRETP